MSAQNSSNIVAFCRECGVGVTQESKRVWQSVTYCEPCYEKRAPSEPSAPPPIGATSAAEGPSLKSPAENVPPHDYPVPSTGLTPVDDGTPSAALALILGIIPGVGAIYNGQYAKGVIHVVVFGGLISIMSSGSANGAEPIFALMLALMVFYMPIEAYQTARKLQKGEAVDELSGIWTPKSGKSSPAVGVALIALGVFFLLNTLGFLQIYRLVRFWPVLLIALGGYLVYQRIKENQQSESEKEETDASQSAHRSAAGGLGLASERPTVSPRTEPPAEPGAPAPLPPRDNTGDNPSSSDEAER